MGEALIMRRGGGTDTSDATATANKILSPYTAYANGEKVTGTIGTKAAATITPGTSDQIITAGQYLGGNQTIAGDADLVTGNIKSGANIFGVGGKASVVDTADATAAAAQILSGLTAYVNGAKVTGSIPSKSAATITPGTSNQTIAAGQYLSGIQTILGDPDLLAANIKNGKNIFGVNGTLDTQIVIGRYTTANSNTYREFTVTGMNGRPKAIIVCANGCNPAYEWDSQALGQVIVASAYLSSTMAFCIDRISYSDSFRLTTGSNAVSCFTLYDDGFKFRSRNNSAFNPGSDVDDGATYLAVL